MTPMYRWIMRSGLSGLILSSGLVLAAAACGTSSPQGPAADDENQFPGPAEIAGLRIDLVVSGGIAGVAYAVRVDGDAGVLMGVRCVRMCEFTDGEILRQLSRDDFDLLSGDLVAAGILDLVDVDFGVSCCDQFYFDLVYSEARGQAHIRGNSEVIPTDISAAIGRLLGLIP